MSTILEQKIDPNEIFEAYKYYMRIIGKKKISIPKAKDITKTYMWRQFAFFIKKLEEYEIYDKEFIDKIIRMVIKKAKENDDLNRHSSVLTKSDVLEQSIKEIEDEFDRLDRFIKNLSDKYSFLKEISVKKGDLLSILINKKNHKSYSNITCWINEGVIDKYCVALSKTCLRAIKRIDDDERGYFPDLLEIIKIRNVLLRNKTIKDQIHKIFGRDLATRGVK